jgi:hypothetical protein
MELLAFSPEVGGMAGTLKRQGITILIGLMWLRVESSWWLFGNELADSLKDIEFLDRLSDF